MRTATVLSLFLIPILGISQSTSSSPTSAPRVASTADSDDVITPNADSISLEKKIAAYLSRKGMNANLQITPDGKGHLVLVTFPSDSVPGKTNVRFALGVSPLSQDAKTQGILLTLVTGMEVIPNTAIDLLINTKNRDGVCAWSFDDKANIQCRAMPLMVTGYAFPIETISRLILMSTASWSTLMPVIVAYNK